MFPFSSRRGSCGTGTTDRPRRAGATGPRPPGASEAMMRCHVAARPFKSSGWTAAVHPRPIACSDERPGSQIVLVEKVGVSIRACRPGQRRDRVGDQLEVPLARAQGVLGALPLVNVRQQDAPANDVVAGITKRKTAVLEPPIDAIRSPKPLHDLVWSARADRSCEHLDDVRRSSG